MQPLDKQTDSGEPVNECVSDLMDTMPLVMRTLIMEVHRRRPADLSHQQFRTLAFLHHHEGASLSELAEHAGTSLPSTSKMIDGLVSRAMVTRQPYAKDRRRVELRLTDHGKSAFEDAETGAKARMGEILSALEPEECDAIRKAMSALRNAFRPYGRPAGM